MDTPFTHLHHLIRTVPAMTREDTVGLLAMASALHAALTVHLLTLGPAPVEDPNRLLKVKEAAQRLGISPRHLYRIADELPFTRRDLGGVLFHVGGLSRYIAAQKKER